ncbi:MAG: sugar nucleotide-binding protein [Candidatus Saccharimonas sp.]|nr:sugar nucleotide-binding protein [Planctomycetaceae bacterium]
MDKVLVAGIETIIGGNLAAGLGQQSPVTGVALGEPTQIAGINVEPQAASTPEGVRQIIQRVRPQRVVLCGNAARSGWDDSVPPSEADLEQASWWSDAVRQSGAQLTLISSDAIFTGPWMFHAENSHSVCPSPSAQIARDIEARVLADCPDALIVRTHAFGWQPGEKSGWIESLLTNLERGFDTDLDCIRYSSPILATDLTEIISGAWTVGLSGVYHVAGAERVNPVQFASRLAQQFHLPIPLTVARESLIGRPSGFGCGETSLQTRKIRRALGVSMPMLDEGLQRLFQQHVEGYRGRLSGGSRVPASRVA